ncbi:hypothetical protein I552_4204 [Mycobacterium xenopi 3993]|nr:hypothetical protein I552_4204 [Mycobacterium xenopi 3993]
MAFVCGELDGSGGQWPRSFRVAREPESPSFRALLRLLA